MITAKHTKDTKCKAVQRISASAFHCIKLWISRLFSIGKFIKGQPRHLRGVLIFFGFPHNKPNLTAKLSTFTFLLLLTYDRYVLRSPCWKYSILLGTSGHLVKPCETVPMGQGSLLALFTCGWFTFRLWFAYGPDSVFFFGVSKSLQLYNTVE